MSRLGEAERAALVLLAILRDVEKATNDIDVMRLIVEVRSVHAGITVTMAKLEGEK